MKPLAVSVGDNCIDHYLPPLDCNFSGGNAVNVAVYLQRSGLSVAYIGAVGNDAHGRQILSDLKREGVDVSRVKVLPGHTACTHVRLGLTGDRKFIHEDLGQKDAFVLDEDDIAFILQHRLVHNTWQGGTEHYLSRFKKSPAILVSQDYGERYTWDFVEQTIHYVDLAFFSVPENAIDKAPDLARRIYSLGPRLVVMTQGRNGSLVFNGEFYRYPARQVEATDTLGAGDAYIGAFLASLLKGKKILQCMEYATHIAGEACTHYGGW